MKKLIALSAAALVSLSSLAASFTLYHGDKALKDGDSYNVGYEENVLIPGLMSRCTWDADLYLQADPSVTVSVSFTASMANTQFCGFDGQCIYNANPNETKAKTGKTKTAEPENLRIDFTHNIQPGTSMITEPNVVIVNVVNNSRPMDNITITVNFLPKSAEEVAAEQGGGTPGDANGDGVIDISDVGDLVNSICGIGTASTLADVNNDGFVDISDLGALINIICGI